MRNSNVQHIVDIKVAHVQTQGMRIDGGIRRQYQMVSIGYLAPWSLFSAALFYSLFYQKCSR